MFKYVGAIIAVVIGVGGCASTQVEVTKAALPSAVKPYQKIESTLMCIKHSGVLRGKVFSVGSFADSTGKINAVSEGNTGNFLPQGGSSAYVTNALRNAGAQVISTYFGQPSKEIKADYAVNGIFNSLDFSMPINADIRVSGIGPIIGKGWAQLTLSIQLDQADTRLNRQMSMIQRPVRYQQIGVGVGHSFGGILTTGSITTSNQERLQLEALNGPIALGVADVVMKEFPKASQMCRGMVADLLATE